MCVHVDSLLTCLFAFEQKLQVSVAKAFAYFGFGSVCFNLFTSQFNVRSLSPCKPTWMILVRATVDSFVAQRPLLRTHSTRPHMCFDGFL